jgi:hypothetical protein
MLDVAESLVGSYFKYVLRCKPVLYDLSMPDFWKIDVIAFKRNGNRAYLCVVLPDISVLLHGDENDVYKIIEKVRWVKDFAEDQFGPRHYEVQVWAPAASAEVVKMLEKHVSNLSSQGITLTLAVNDEYARRINRLRVHARADTRETDEPAYRLLQILEAMTPLPGDSLI